MGVNQLARQLLHVDHPGSEEIIARQNQLNTKWSSLREKSEMKREELNSAHGVQTFHIECRETVTWIEDKMRVLEQTDELRMDLTGIMTLQRKLSGMERDLAAIQAKLDSLEEESEKISKTHPEEAIVIQQRINRLREVWELLTEMLKERDAKLEEAGDLHRFLKDLDHFQAWLTKTESGIANEDTPSSLAEAEKLLSQHQQIREEIDSYTNDYSSMMDYGEKVTADPSTFDDPQYMFLRERLNALKGGWEEVHQMWENRQQLLSQSLNLQMFNRDAKQAEVLLSQQHFAAEKIARKAEDISDRRNTNHEMALSQLEKLRDQLLLHQFLQDCEELHDWIQEKSVLVQEDTYRSAKTIHSKWTRHEAFRSEIASNKERLEKVTECGNTLLQSKPEMAEMIGPKLSELGTEFVTLEKKTEEKGDRLFDSKREEIIRQGIDDVDGFAEEVLPLLEDGVDDGKDLTSVNILLQKQSIWETTVMAKTRQIEDLKGQADHLSRISPEKADEFKQTTEQVANKFDTIKGPLEQRRKELEVKKEVFQFMRDVDDENIW